MGSGRVLVVLDRWPELPIELVLLRKPVASNYDGWQAVVATEAGAAIILDPDDSETAARELVAALRNDEWLKRAGEAARSLAAGQFSRDRHAADLEQVLTQCAGS